MGDPMHLWSELNFPGMGSVFLQQDGSLSCAVANLSILCLQTTIDVFVNEGGGIRSMRPGRIRRSRIAAPAASAEYLDPWSHLHVAERHAAPAVLPPRQNRKVSAMVRRFISFALA